MDFNNDKHLDICQNIEVGLKYQYEINPHLTDSICILALDNAKIAIKQQFGYARNESVSHIPEIKGIIDWCVAVGLEHIEETNGLTLKEYVAAIEKIRRSVARHAKDGSRGYYEFIQNFLP